MVYEKRKSRLTCVRANVNLKVFKTGETFGARCALVRSLVRVSANVDQHLVPET